MIKQAALDHSALGLENFTVGKPVHLQDGLWRWNRFMMSLFLMLLLEFCQLLQDRSVFDTGDMFQVSSLL